MLGTTTADRKSAPITIADATEATLVYVEKIIFIYLLIAVIVMTETTHSKLAQERTARSLLNN